MSYIIEMESETFGTDVYEYDTKQEMQKGLLELVDKALRWSATDDIGRSFVVVEEK